MSPKLVAFFALAMVFALVAGTAAEERDEMVGLDSFAKLTLPSEAVLSRVVRADGPKKCGDGTLCVTACIKESGKWKCAP